MIVKFQAHTHDEHNTTVVIFIVNTNQFQYRILA